MARATEVLDVTAPQADRLTFWNIEQSHVELLEFRDELAATQERDKVDLSAELATCDAEIRKFVELSIRKVTAIAGLWRMCDAIIAVLVSEQKRLAAKLAMWTGRRDRIKNVAHEVMIALELQQVEGASDRLRRQKNPVALECYDVLAIPDQYMKVNVKMSMREWKRLLSMIPDRATRTDMPAMLVNSEVENAVLKAALLERLDCQTCKGTGQVPSADGKSVEDCAACVGVGTIATVIAGARLTTGEHLRLE
jgi:hypothetical protein